MSKRLITTVIGIATVIAVSWFGLPKAQATELTDAIVKIIQIAIIAFGSQDVVKAAKGN